MIIAHGNFENMVKGLELLIKCQEFSSFDFGESRKVKTDLLPGRSQGKEGKSSSDTCCQFGIDCGHGIQDDNVSPWGSYALHSLQGMQVFAFTISKGRSSMT